MDKSELYKKAFQIRDASSFHENTAKRVGSMLVDIIDKLTDFDVISRLLDAFAKELEKISEYFIPIDASGTAVDTLAEAVALKAALGVFSPNFLATTGKTYAYGGAEFGSFIAGLYTGTGGAVDKDGNAEFQSLRVRSFLEVLELIVNRLSALEGDQLLTEADTVERIVKISDTVYGLYLRSKWDGYFTAISSGSVLKGIINTLAAGSGSYYTAWMRVNSVNTAANYIEVTVYPDNETPAGQNFPPCEMMNVARWGHQTDTKRQSCLYLSSTGGASCDSRA